MKAKWADNPLAQGWIITEFAATANHLAKKSRSWPCPTRQGLLVLTMRCQPHVDLLRYLDPGGWEEASLEVRGMRRQREEGPLDGLGGPLTRSLMAKDRRKSSRTRVVLS